MKKVLDPKSSIGGRMSQAARREPPKKCGTCNGWGVILSIDEPAPSKMENRLQLRADPKKLRLKELACLSCGGYGTK